MKKYNKRLSSGVYIWSPLTHFKGLQIDLAYITEEEISMYADDHQIFASGLSTSIVEGKVMSEGKIT